MARRLGARTVGVGRARGGGRGYPTPRVDDVRDVPDQALSPGGRGADGATVSLLADGRFTLGLGAGENLNEHVVGGSWPPANTRHAMFAEAVEIISRLFAGGYVNYRGDFFEVDSAKLWDRPDIAPPIGIAVSGSQSCELAGKYADMMIAVEPDPDLSAMFDRAGGEGKPRVGQLPVSFGTDRDAAIHPRTWPSPSRAPRRSTSSSRRCEPSPTPDSAMLLWCKSEGTNRNRLSGGPERSSCPSCARSSGSTRKEDPAARPGPLCVPDDDQPG
jgi:hypothetical protein